MCGLACSESAPELLALSLSWSRQAFRLTQRAADWRYAPPKKADPERGSFFRFVGWLSRHPLTQTVGRLSQEYKNTIIQLIM